MDNFWLQAGFLIAIDVALVLLQSVIVNRLGLAFAGVTAFAGLGGYAVAVVSRAGATQTKLVVMGLLTLGLFLLCAPRLKSDRFLLVTLASLGVLRALAGGLDDFGGQDGLPVDRPHAQALRLVLAFVLSGLICTHLLVTRGALGILIDASRIATKDIIATNLVPVAPVQIISLIVCACAAGLLGMIRGLYAGRVNPDTFGFGYATIVLLATLIAGGTTGRTLLAATALFSFSDVFASLIGYSMVSGAFVRDILLGAFVLFAVHVSLDQEEQPT